MYALLDWPLELNRKNFELKWKICIVFIESVKKFTYFLVEATQMNSLQDLVL